MTTISTALITASPPPLSARSLLRSLMMPDSDVPGKPIRALEHVFRLCLISVAKRAEVSPASLVLTNAAFNGFHLSNFGILWQKRWGRLASQPVICIARVLAGLAVFLLEASFVLQYVQRLAPSISKH